MRDARRKDCSAFLKNFAGLGAASIAVPIPRQEKSLPADAVAAAAACHRDPAQEAAGHRGCAFGVSVSSGSMSRRVC